MDQTAIQDPTQSTNGSPKLVMVVLGAQQRPSRTNLVWKESLIPVQPEDEFVEGLGVGPEVPECGQGVLRRESHASTEGIQRPKLAHVVFMIQTSRICWRRQARGGEEEMAAVERDDGILSILPPDLPTQEIMETMKPKSSTRPCPPLK